ncbi:PREDICTED: DNA replication factor Cdt1 isoform X2 [Polistes canadensis]|uniref:DNA replication factor Cdt1 isoform X2 n=1 Tax=Polistes canadensis TaxID=91411 RepID=UPI000718C932|nr:PREDICTED: DNA replication factor Cdt1 isoform X2 [Polistes canadensis]
MSQPSVTAYFNTRKRQANEDILSKSKVLLLDQEHMKMTEESEMKVKTQNFQPLKLVSEKQEETMKINKASTRSRSAQVCKSNQDRQTDIRESFLKKSNDADIKKESVKKVLFEKKGTLSPKKQPLMPKKNVAEDKQTAVNEQNESTSVIFTTPKKKTRNDSIRKDLDLNEIKDKINKSGRLAKLKASIDRITKCDQRLNEVQKRNDLNKPQIQKFEQIQLEIPVSPQKNLKSPCKAFMSPKKELLAQTSPQRRILFEPKESISPIKSKPDKTEAYQKYLSLAESDKPRLQLPYNYRLLAEIFRYIDTVSAMLFNRKELITFKKLKPAVQELLRRNVTLEHLAQIKTIYPDAYNFHQEKVKSFGSTSKQDKYELILTPNVQEVKSDLNERNEDNVLQTANDVSMSPAILLQRKRKFYEILLDKVKAEHEQFLLKLDKPMVIPKEKIIRWHPEFNVDGCKPIEQSALPQPPNVEKATSAKHVLEKAKSLFHCNTRMEKALQRLAEAKMTSKSVSTDISSTEDPNDDTVKQVNITIVDSPSVTPTIEKSYLATAFKGIPNSLLEKVRAKQAAKALETMTRTPDLDKEAALYSRLPELAKILRSIFVAEKKGVLTLEHVLAKLDNSFRTKLTAAELEEHVRKLCKLLPTWASIHNVRKTDYLKLAKDVDLIKVTKMLEIMANHKVKKS